MLIAARRRLGVVLSDAGIRSSTRARLELIRHRVVPELETTGGDERGGPGSGGTAGSCQPERAEGSRCGSSLTVEVAAPSLHTSANSLVRRRSKLSTDRFWTWWEGSA